MAHVAKFTRAAAGHLCKHFERAKDEHGQYINFENQNIDTAKSNQNYNLAPDRPDGQMEFLQKRCSEVKCLKRDNVNVMCSWVVTAPKSVVDSMSESDFFRKTYDFLLQRYGAENVVSAHVHMDEVTPHMHFAFVPVTLDKKKNIYKVSAKEVIDRNELKKFHDDLDRHLSQSLRPEQYRGDILNDATKDGNKSIEQLKRQSASQLLAKIEKREQAADANIQKAKKDVQALRKKSDALKAEIGGLERAAMSARELTLLQPEKTLTGAIKGLSVEDIETLKQMALEYLKIEPEYRQQKNQIDKLTRDSKLTFEERLHMMDLEKKISKLKKSDADQHERIRQLEKMLTDNGIKIQEIAPSQDKPRRNIDLDFSR